MVDHLQIFLFDLRKDGLEILRILKKELVFVEVIRHVDQMQIKQLLKSVVPVGISHFSMVSVVVFRPLSGPILRRIGVVLPSVVVERELRLDVLMNILVVLEDDVIVKSGVSLVLIDPLLLQPLLLLLHTDCASFQEVCRGEQQEELLVADLVAQGVLVLVNFTLYLRNHLLVLLYRLVFLCLLSLQSFLLLFFLFSHLFID